MKLWQKSSKRKLSVMLSVSLAMLLVLAIGIFPGGAVSAASAYSDADGHWAAEQLNTAVREGWITAFEDGALRPDAPLTGAQAVTSLCGILDVPLQEADTADEWDIPAKNAAVRMGFADAGLNTDEPLSRLDAFLMIARAFVLDSPETYTACLNAYSDLPALSESEQRLLASMINGGFVYGAEGKLNPDAAISRAEYCVVLSRLMADSAVSKEGLVQDWDGSRLWIGARSGLVTLRNVHADTVILRSLEPAGLELRDCEIGTLVLAHTGNLYIAASSINDVYIASGSTDISINGHDGETVTASSVIVGGSGSGVSLRGNCESLRVYGAECTVSVSGSCGAAALLGRQTALSVGTQSGSLMVCAPDAQIGGDGRFDGVELWSARVSLPEDQQNVTDLADHGLEYVDIAFDAPAESIPVPSWLHMDATVSGGSVVCDLEWLMDGESIYQGTANLAAESVYALEYTFTYSPYMDRSSDVTLRLSYTTAEGEYQVVEKTETLSLDVLRESSYLMPYANEIVSRITEVYQGDYTTQWALEHDYTDAEKEVFVNYMGYSSPTSYLVWINKGCQRVNIFWGSQGNWELIRTCLVGTGAKWTPTPSGVYQITTREVGWFMSTYAVRPVVRFKGGGYAFHSRLYYPNLSGLSDPSIGFPVSHGCVRMMDEDIQFMYDYVPNRTTVVSF